MAWEMFSDIGQCFRMLYRYFAPPSLRIEVHGVKCNVDQENRKPVIVNLHKGAHADLNGIKLQEYESHTKLLRDIEPIKALINRKEKPIETLNGKVEATEVLNKIDFEEKLYSLEKSFERIEEQEEKGIKKCYESLEKYKIKQEKEMKEFSETYDRRIQEIQEAFGKQVDEARHSFKGEIIQDITTIKIENDSMKNESKECEDKNQCMHYIAQICLALQTNMYHYVLPDHFAENWHYKVKNIEKDIHDLLIDEERKAAIERWEELKRKLGWDPSLERTLKKLQKNGTSIDRPECLTVEEAERVAEELDKQGRLRGRTSYEKVKKIIEMWKITATLVQ